MTEKPPFRHHRRKGTAMVLVTLIMLVIASMGPVGAEGAEKAKKEQVTTGDKQTASSVKGLADLAPLATELSERSTALKKQIAEMPHVSATEKEFARITTQLEALENQFDTLKAMENYSFTRLVDLKVAVEFQAEALDKVITPITKAISQLGLSKKKWVEEKKRWQDLDASLPKDAPREMVAPLFTKAEGTVNESLALISRITPPMVKLQQEAIEIQEKIHSLATDVDALLLALRGEVLRRSSPSMFSSSYYAQFHSGLWDEMGEGLKALPSPWRKFSSRDGWMVLLHGLLTLMISIGLLRLRGSIEREKKWKTLVDHPFTVGLFLGVWIFGPLYERGSSTWKVILWTIGGITAARLVGRLVPDFRRKAAVYAMAIVVITLELFPAISLPAPLFHLYVFGVAMVGLCLCLSRVRKSAQRGEPRFYTWMLRLGVVVFAAVVIAEFGGYSAFASYLLDSVFKTLFLLLLLWTIVLLAKDGFKLVFGTRFMRKTPLLQKNAGRIIQQTILLFGLLMGVFAVACILVIWKIYEGSLMAAVEALLSLGFSIGSSRLTLGLFISAAAVLYGAFVISWTVQAVLMYGVLARREVQFGVRVSMGRLVHYALVFVGFLLVLAMLGINLQNITIIGGALGVGVGFGLRDIVNNFVSGMILLFERPIKMGDYIQLDEQWGRVTKLGLRATVVRLRDRSEIVVPNSELVSQRVTNLTLSDRFVRIMVPVGVAYGSDVSLVLNTLRECAEANSAVATTPAPQALFMEFGESSLDFELRVWVSDIDKRREVQSNLHQEIDRRFRQLGIQIPFPQRDLHIQSTDKSTSGPLNT